MWTESMCVLCNTAVCGDPGGVISGAKNRKINPRFPPSLRGVVCRVPSALLTPCILQQ